MPSTEIILEASELRQSYGPKEVLHGLNFQVGAGAVGLLGPNGSGKSTLLRTFLGLLPVERGHARVLGLDPAESPLEIRRRIGLVPESECMVPGMNAVELTAYVGELAGMSGPDAMERAHQVLYYVGLGEARYRDLGSYSQGMKQRLKLAQGIVHDPDLVLLDEPTNGMDPPGREAMLALIRDISRSKGVSVVLSTHLLPDVQETCDHVLVLKDGAVVAQRPVEFDVSRQHLLFDVLGRGELVALGDRLRAGGHEFKEIKNGIRVTLASGLRGPEPIFAAAVALEGRVEIRHLIAAGHTVEDTFFEAIS